MQYAPVEGCVGI